MIGYKKVKVNNVYTSRGLNLVNIQTTTIEKELGKDIEVDEEYEYNYKTKMWLLDNKEVDLNTEAYLRNAVKQYFSNPNTDESLMELFGLVQTV